jgi:Domain of unknown function (DUF1707)
VEPHRDSAADADPAPSVRDLDRAGEVPAGGVTASPRASNADRDAAATRLQDAFADGRLDDAEFDERMRTALTAKTQAGLDALLGDLPARTPGAAAPVAAMGTGRGAGRPGRYAIGWKGSVRRAGRWRVPERYTAVVYKGGGVLDLRAAELLSPVTTIVAVAYKSDIRMLVPPGVRVEMTGFGITQGPSDDMVLAPDAPVLHVRGLAYKGSIETASRPTGRPRLP